MNEFEFLVKLALDLGALEAKVIPASEIVVEDRVILKCKVGCPSYGKKFICPPFVPTVDEFRKMLKDYRSALLVRFPAEAEIEEKIGHSLLRNLFDTTVSKQDNETAVKFWSQWGEDKNKIHLAVLELEKAAFNHGFTFALGFTTGSCVLCKKCNVKMGTCVHPTMARMPEHAVGVNMKKTVEKAGMTLPFPFQKKPVPIALLLID
jgi:predicted metal-binding protein